MNLIFFYFRAAFLPYLEESYQELLALLDYPSSRVKKGAVAALGQFCICVHEVNKIPSSGDNGPSHLGTSVLLILSFAIKHSNTVNFYVVAPTL